MKSEEREPIRSSDIKRCPTCGRVATGNYCTKDGSDLQEVPVKSLTAENLLGVAHQLMHIGNYAEMTRPDMML